MSTAKITTLPGPRVWPSLPDEPTLTEALHAAGCEIRRDSRGKPYGYCPATGENIGVQYPDGYPMQGSARLAATWAWLRERGHIPARG